MERLYIKIFNDKEPVDLSCDTALLLNMTR